MIHTLRLPMSNVHLAVGQRSVLFDTGSPRDADRILRWLAGLGAPPISAILLTHAHADHAGSAAALRKALGMPIALAPADWQMTAQGHNGQLRVARLSALPLKFMVPQGFPAFTPDIALGPDTPLADFGLTGQIIATPGHTPGSISALFPNGDAIAGDVLMGGFLGGAVRPHRPRTHYFVADATRNRASLDALLQSGAQRLHVGHGGPLQTAHLPPPPTPKAPQ